MANSIYQGKTIRQFWGKIIRQSTKTDCCKCRMTNFFLLEIE